MKLTHMIRKLQGPSLILSIGAGSVLLAASGLTYAQVEEEGELGEQTPQELLQQEGTDIVVEQKQPQVQVEQAPVEVIAEQEPMDVQVETGEPEVSIEQPEPEVMVQQQEPEVIVEQQEPQVIVESAEPQVQVRSAEPEVIVNDVEPIVRVITVDETGQEQISEIEAQPFEGEEAVAEAEAGFEEEEALAEAEVGFEEDQIATDLMEADLAEIQDMTIVTSVGDELGTVEDIVVNPDQGRAGFVVSTGGVLGFGGRQIFVPASEAELQQDQIVWQTQRTPEQIVQEAEFEEAEYVSIADAEGTLEEARLEIMQRAER